MHNGITILLILLSVLSSSAQKLQGLPFVKYYSTQDYEGGIQNWSITQNNEGLIYIANNFGLLEFDGTTWNRYILPSETKMRDVIIGDKGRIYVASQGDFGYYLPTNSGTLHFTSLADSLPDKYRNFDETWKVYKVNKKVIFCTFRQIFIFENDKLVKVVDPVYAPENFHFVNHTLFINQLEIGLSYLKGDSLKLFDNGGFFIGKAITGIIPLTNNHLLITTSEHGIYTYDGHGFDKWVIKNNPQFLLSSINNAIRLRNGNIAIGTQNNGLFITTPNGELIHHLSKDKGLNNRTILSIFEDMMGNLWLGHNNGLTTVELNMPFTMISEQAGLPGTGYDGYLSNRNIYLGTNNGLYSKPISGDGTNYKFVDNTEGQVYSIQNLDNLLLLGHHKGAFTIEDNITSQVSDVLGSWTFLKLQDKPNYVIGGTYKGLLLFKKTEKGLKFIHKIKGFNESSRVMNQDEEGNIWMTHGYKGVYKLNLNPALDFVSVKYYGTESGLPSNILINVWRVNNRLIFSTESQIYKYDPKDDAFVIDEFFKPYFPPGSRISFLEQDPMGNIYYLSTDEMGVLERLSNGTYIKKSKIFNRLKGLLNDDLQNLSVLNANNVIYGAKEGFILYDKNLDNQREIPFKTLIRKVIVTSGKDSLISNGYYINKEGITAKQPEKQRVELDHSLNSIRIEYSAPFFHNSQNTKYQFKLEKIDKRWSDWTTKHDKEYTNLREGNYTFKVRAINIYDQVSEEAAFSFIILPPWYRTNTAFFSYALVIVAFLISVFYFFETRFKKEKQIMTIRQEKELSRIDSELRSSEEELQKLRNEKLIGEVESKNKELATSTMHLLNKNSFINSVKHNISTIIKRSKNQEVKKELSKIMSNIDKNIAEDDDWDHFAIHFDQVHGEFTRRIKDSYPHLTPQEMKLSAYLRMNLSTKEIAHLLNISARGVEIARYRLRKKLNLERSVNLQEFILKY